MLRALLIEDNAALRQHLRRGLETHGGVVITGEADSVGRARTLLAGGDYDLVFLDVQLRGGEAFAVTALVLAPARCVFVTTEPRFAAEAFDRDALDYLIKPVSAARLAQCLKRAARELPSSAAPASPSALLGAGAGARRVSVDQIAAVLAQQNYTAVWLHSGARHLVRRTLKDWQDFLPASQFVRATRGALVNLGFVTRVERTGEKAALLSVTGCAVPIKASNRRASAVRAALARRKSR